MKLDKLLWKVLKILLVNILYFSICITPVDCFFVKNFITRHQLNDGEQEMFLHYNGIIAKETSLENGNSIKFRQLTDGNHFIQLIYTTNNSLIDCEYIKEPLTVNTFIQNFFRDLNTYTYANSNNTSTQVARTKHDMPKWFNYNRLKHSCEKVHLRIEKKFFDEKSSWRSRRHAVLEQLSEFFIAPGTKWCGRSTLANRYSELGPEFGLDKCCRKHDHCRVNVSGFSKKWDFRNTSPFTISHCRCDSRGKRGLEDLLLFPGMKWCGKGRSAKKYTHLGGYHTVDKCCRTHDTACPFWIGAFERKYGLFNWRINTIMHCACDQRFRACLKLADSNVANMVGKLFFNIVQTKCFVLRSKKVCKKRAWWGNKCLKYGQKKKAVLRDNVPY